MERLSCKYMVLKTQSNLYNNPQAGIFSLKLEILISLFFRFADETKKEIVLKTKPENVPVMHCGDRYCTIVEAANLVEEKLGIKSHYYISCSKWQDITYIFKIHYSTLGICYFKF